MEISDILFSKLRGRELISVIVWSFAFGTILFSPLICAQETTKASVGVMLEGVTPMGEIRVELPPGTDFTVMERERDTLKLRKGPFCGSVPFAKTELWRPPPNAIAHSHSGIDIDFSQSRKRIPRSSAIPYVGGVCCEYPHSSQ